MKPKILVTREVFTDVLDYLGEHFDVTSNQADAVMSPQALAAALDDKQGALITIADRVDATLIAGCPSLKALCNIAVGYNNIDVAACTARRVMVTNTPGVLDDSTADFTWALILATARRVTEAEAYLRAGEWKGWKLKQFLGVDVHHATLGILGLGRIGQAVARRGRGFDMNVLYHEPKRLPPDVEKACGAKHVSFDELLSGADILTIHVPYAPATHHLVGAAEIAKMKPTAILIHAARGGVVDDKALFNALKQRRIVAAGLDVYENEPNFLPDLLTLKNVVLVPHIASSTESTRHRMAMMAAENLVAALTGTRPPQWLNPW